MSPPSNTTPQRQHGDYFSHSNCPRAQIFRRDLAGVRELQQLQKVMRSNDYTRDPLAHNNSEFQIAARFDLLDPATTNETSSCGGAFDAKVAPHPIILRFRSSDSRTHAAAGHVFVASCKPQRPRRQRPHQRQCARFLMCTPHPEHNSYRFKHTPHPIYPSSLELACHASYRGVVAGLCRPRARGHA